MKRGSNLTTHIFNRADDNHVNTSEKILRNTCSKIVEISWGIMRLAFYDGEKRRKTFLEISTFSAVDILPISILINQGQLISFITISRGIGKRELPGYVCSTPLIVPDRLVPINLCELCQVVLEQWAYIHNDYRLCYAKFH
ncbi:hypothetical protein T01_2963 [Trichinella spiralis]|uniref:Uncharacterized protein n=1 Tax=Trichinella spiralis TaxID=6334 RepID=A0A0V1AW84_TRISP|nr:hypothetical protein T01_2963 [Trichinella spiralis]